MARLSGHAGSVYIGSNIAGIKSWSLDYTKDILPGRGFDDSGAPHPVPGGYDWSGSFEGDKDGAPQALDGAEATLELRESQTATQKWSGTAIISGVHPKTSHDGLVTYSYDFVGKSTLTVPTA